MSRFPNLFEPIHIGTIELRNRIVMCPMGTNFASEDGMPTEQMVNYYAERAKGGVGLIIIEQTIVQPRGRWSLRAPGMWNDKFIPEWRKVVDAVHSYNSKIAIQLGHMGASATSKLTGEQPIGPSPVPDYLSKEVPHEMSLDEIHLFIQDYVSAVSRAVEAGFDAVELHGTHGYLIASFMSGRTNRRTDRYGGTLEGRLRLPIEIIRAVRQEIGPNYPLLMRIASVEPKEGRFLEETRVIAGALAEEGLNAIDISAGSFAEIEWEVPPYFFSTGFNLENIEKIKRSVSVPVIACGRITEPRFAERIIAEGRADLIGLGRALLADPDWPRKADSGHLDEIRRCIGCTRCIDFQFFAEDTKLRCNVNPFLGKETKIEIKKANVKKKVLVVGGGPAGLYASAIAASRGHDVTLWEKSGTLGGQIRIAAMAPQKHEVASVISWTENEARKSGAKLELAREATADSILAFNPDVVVVATGATALMPNIPGIELPRVVSASDVLAGKASVGNKVLIIGGGSVGCETAHFLANYKKDVTILEMLGEMGHNLAYMVKPTILQVLKDHQVKMLPSTKVKEIIEDGVVAETDGQNKVFRGYDNIVMATGSKSENRLYTEMRKHVPEAYCIGDAREPRKILEALSEGLEVALKI